MGVDGMHEFALLPELIPKQGAVPRTQDTEA